MINISTTFEDRFEEFALKEHKGQEYEGYITTDGWLNALSEIDKQVAEERKHFIHAIENLLKMIPEETLPRTHEMGCLTYREYIESIISKYSEEK